MTRISTGTNTAGVPRYSSTSSSHVGKSPTSLLITLYGRSNAPNGPQSMDG
ncbi:hypothetical protein DPMN_050966 [Dreissena polymorpha]|uniref:Uncharacterized protein n=1 Tax=Dreissena polymorpha TaxID=45954 RepID=A0A9D4CH27_DREPO|nr:hypothetical protein DPMN_050966 [Dreissena polymorpha]